MINKYLEKRVTIIFNEEFLETKKLMELEYYLTESDNKEIEDVDHEKLYGIEIVKIVDDVKMENKLVKNLFCCKEETQKVLKKLVDNTVTPMGMLYVLDDMLGIV